MITAKHHLQIHPGKFDENSFTMQNFTRPKKPLILRVSRGGPLQFGCRTMRGGSINTFSTILWAREANSRKRKDSIRHFMFYFILRSGIKIIRCRTNFLVWTNFKKKQISRFDKYRSFYLKKFPPCISLYKKGFLFTKDFRALLQNMPRRLLWHDQTIALSLMFPPVVLCEFCNIFVCILLYLCV